MPPPAPPAQVSAPALIAASALTLTLQSPAGPVKILRGVDLTLARHETVSVVGASGSGKTSLLMVLAGLEPATGGALSLLGQDMRGLGQDALARLRRRHIGIVFQAFHLIPSMTALENVAVPLELAGRRDAMALAREALAEVGLGHRLTHLPGQLSGGEQQRVALARAFAPRPDLLMADEPTGNLDQVTGAAVMDLLFRRLADTGASLLLITHDPGLAARCGRHLTMANGRLGS